MSRTLVRRLVPGLSCALLAACVGYHPAPVSVACAAAAARPVASERPLPFEAAVRLLVERNAELARLRAEAAAVNLSPGPAPLDGSVKVDDGDVTETMIGTDVLSLFGIGPRRAEIALAHARQNEIVLRHHERARDLVAALAAAYAVDAALARQPSPRPDLDLEAFRRAGLLSDADLAAAEGAIALADAEVVVVRTEREDARREIARLLGAPPSNPVQPDLPAPSWPPVPEPTDVALLYARGDLQRLLAAYETADRRFRFAVARQWPALVIRAGGNVSMESPMGVFSLVLPLDAPAEAQAMLRAREASRAAVEEGVLDATHDAARERLRLEGAEAELVGAEARRAAAGAVVRAARARVETDAEAFPGLVLAALEEVRAAREVRQAAEAVARSRVAAARAAGWPGPEIVEAAR